MTTAKPRGLAKPRQTAYPRMPRNWSLPTGSSIWPVGTLGEPPLKTLYRPQKEHPSGEKTSYVSRRCPADPTGWHTDLVDDMTVVQYRHDNDQWRGNAIAFSSECQILRRRGCRFGIWLRLRHTPTQNELWIASLRLSTGTTSDVTAEELQNVCSLLPPTLLPVIMLGDL